MDRTVVFIQIVNFDNILIFGLSAIKLERAPF
jgi:hypothetical protein